jgi:hypothetical protein
MENVDTERLEFLSEKNINDNITPDELKELSALLVHWNLSVESR